MRKTPLRPCAKYSRKNQDIINSSLESLKSYPELAVFEKEHAQILHQRVFQSEKQALELKLVRAFVRENSWQQFPDFAAAHPRNRFVLDPANKAYLSIATSTQISDFRDFPKKTQPKSHFPIFSPGPKSMNWPIGARN